MENATGSDILTAIIAAEQEIEERLAAEEQAAAHMLDQLRQELEQGAAREAERLAGSLQLAVAAAREDAQQRAAAEVRRAGSEVAQLDSIDTETLERCIMRHLSQIIRE
jgi:hypothetical protein